MLGEVLWGSEWSSHKRVEEEYLTLLGGQQQAGHLPPHRTGGPSVDHSLKWEAK